MGAIRSGFTSVMMDGSLEADGKSVASYEYNVATTKKVVEFSHSIGVSVEGELGVLGSLETMKGDKEDGHGAEGHMTCEQLLTDVEQAADFVKQTQCDALAIAIGTSHGAYKFTKKPTGDILAIERIKEIHARIPNCHLVMHGSSSVPQELLAEIREFGGDMKETYGVPVEEIVIGIKHGVRKVNIDTDIRLAMTGAIRRYFIENPTKFDPRDYLKPAREAAKKIVLARLELRRASNVLQPAARRPTKSEYDLCRGPAGRQVARRWQDVRDARRRRRQSRAGARRSTRHLGRPAQLETPHDRQRRRIRHLIQPGRHVGFRSDHGDGPGVRRHRG
jgi:fructose-bisphosphate aldolase class II